MMSERFRKGWYLNLSICLGALGPYFQLQFGWHHVKNQPQSRFLLPEFKMAPTSKAFHMESQIKMHCYLPPWWWLNIKTSHFLVNIAGLPWLCWCNPNVNHSPMASFNTFISTAMSSRVGFWLLAFPFLHFFRHAFGDFCTYKNLLQRNSQFFFAGKTCIFQGTSGSQSAQDQWCLCLLPS